VVVYIYLYDSKIYLYNIIKLLKHKVIILGYYKLLGYIQYVKSK